eukprot:SM000205S06229  [mRNA]  locus=s205:146071:150099:- [translate_table: standard]
MVAETPRRGERPSSRDRAKKVRKPGGGGGGDEDDDVEDTPGRAPGKPARKFQTKPARAEAGSAEGQGEEVAAYRDRAKERREDLNLDYAGTATELSGTLSAVAPPGLHDIRSADAHRISIENSKFLGGDVEHTHLVKGLDYALLQKIRSEMDKKDDSEEDRAREAKEDKAMKFHSCTAQAVYQFLLRPHLLNKVNEMFLPGRTAYLFDMDDDFAHELPTTVHRSKADCPAPEEAIAASVDGAVLDRIAKIMAYLRLGSSGKVLKKKKKDKLDSRILVKGISIATEEDVEEPALHAADAIGNVEEAQASGGPPLPPPPPRRTEDNIFEDVDTEYVPSLPSKANGRPAPVAGEAREGSPSRSRGRRGGKSTYFEKQQSLPVPLPQPPQATAAELGPEQGPTMPGPSREYLEDVHAPPPGNGAYDAATYQAYPTAYTYPTYPAGPPPYQDAVPYADPYQELPLEAGEKVMTQEEKDKGLGSVFFRDDEKEKARREKDTREKDPTFVSESYSECYPGYQEYSREVVDSDEEGAGGPAAVKAADVDTGGKVKGRLQRWDFDNEEDWGKYNEAKEATTKAAMQFGVKAQDGRKTRKYNQTGKDREKDNSRDHKIDNELHKINQILERQKKERGNARGRRDVEDYYDLPSGKRSKV